jgi:hypothetical protein
MARRIRDAVEEQLRDGVLDASSLLTEVRGLGPYLESRLRRTFSREDPMTVGDLWSATRNMNTDQVLRTMYRALQNRRGNQCVSDRLASGDGSPKYHTPDVNVHGFEAVMVLLNHARTRPPIRVESTGGRGRTSGRGNGRGRGGVRYGPLPHGLPSRSRESSSCGCRVRCDGPCVSTEDGVCVPRSPRARGFVGSPPHPGQKVLARSDVARRRTRSSARTRRTLSLSRDPDSREDVQAGHPLSMRYTRRNNHLWRVPGRRVRSPTSKR